MKIQSRLEKRDVMHSFLKPKNLLVSLLFFAVSANAQESVKISGVIYGDYFTVIQNHEQTFENKNALWFRRVYLTVDKTLNESFDIRLRLEANTKGDFTTKAKMEPFFKHLYLRWKKDSRSVYFGISGTPTWRVVEPVWGYRSVEKTPLDLQRLSSSADFGIAVKGALGKSKKLSYHVMLANGNSTSSEIGPGKKAMLSLTARPRPGITLEGYVDSDDRPGGKRRFTLQGFGSYERDNFRTGVLLAQQRRRIGSHDDDLKLTIFSVFAVGDITGNVAGIFRYDRTFEPNPEGAEIPYIPFDPTADSHFFLVGADIKTAPGVTFVPNVEIVFYGKNSAGIKPASDIIPRVTFVVTY